MDTSFDMFIETEVPENELIISRTSLSGVITYANETFAKISGYEVEELIGKPHNIVRHPDMPKSVFKEVWDTLALGKNWQGFVKNRRSDNGYYWVHADISGVYKDGKLVEYKSLRSPVDRETKIKMQNHYDALRKTEEKSSRVVLYLTDEQIEAITKII
ncbi:MAG: PAS domain-containing protein [Sulfurovum sp.]|jgi:aerotaxis receptor|nr:PAS domain-containing protein [Sulfurovum sp.]DAB40521.1 MAG TPA: chemotaxis protein [Sulfurovum sp. UBA12169]